MKADDLWDDHGTRADTPCERDLLERLRRLPCEHFEQVAQRLQQSDLLTLARFASAPHPLVHHALAVLQTVLLSLSLVHQTTSSLRVAPWPLLRLDVLANADAMWSKMWKRLARLRRPLHDPQRKPLANAQVRFVLEQVLMAPLLAMSETCQEILDAVGRVSAIAESIAAYVLLCAHYSLVPPPPTSKTSPSKPWPRASFPSPTCSPSKRQLCVEPLLRPRDPLAPMMTKSHQSWRSGVKHRGRFFLFRAAILEDGSPSINTPGVISTFAIDCHHAALQWTKAVSSAEAPNTISAGQRADPNHAYTQSWVKRAPVPTVVASMIAEHRRKSLILNRTSTLSLLLQTAVASELFLPPCPLVGSAFWGSRVEPCLSMHILVMSTATDSITRDTELELVAIGEVQVQGTEPVISDVRRQLVASSGPRTRFHQQLASSSFRFFANGALMSDEDESWQRAVELLPLAIVCLDDSLPRGRSNTSSKCWRPWMPTLSTLNRALGSTLSKHVRSPREVSPATPTSRVVVSLCSLHQSVASLPPSPSSSSPSPAVPISSTIDTLLALFIDWSAFVQFQQLQDTSAILYEYGSPEKPKPSLKHATAPIERDSTEEKLRPELTVAEQELLSLPHEPFCAEKEYLMPLYVTFTFSSRRKAYLRSPYLPDVMSIFTTASESSPLRIAVENAECVVHVLDVTGRHASGLRHDHRLQIRFARDLSCPLEMLMTMRDAFVWVTRKLPSRAHDKVAIDIIDPTRPPRWLRDVFRFVSHPTFDFSRQQKSSAGPSPAVPFPSRYFRVDVPYHAIEKIVEVALWSRGIDWQPHWRACDVESDLLRPKYEAMCLAYPSSFSIDSVKFSKLLRECGLQPQYLTVGDAAFLFTNHRAPGSHYEMIYDGFVDAMKWIARRVPPARNERDETHQLRVFCLEWLIRAPGMTEIWGRLVNRWRLIEKQRYMERAAIEYCAATRIRANWKRLVVRRTLIATLTRLKNERRTAAKLQSLYKMRKVRGYFVQLKACVIQTQRFVRARRQLRKLRLERAQLVEKMRLRLQKWMRQRLRVLRCWKAINAAWLARRARILEKRSRLVCAAAYQIESRLYRASLYRMPSSILAPGDTALASDDTEYELELLEPLTSWFRAIRISSNTFDVLERDAQTQLGVTKPVHARHRKRWKLSVLMQRLHLKTRWVGATVPRRPERREACASPHTLSNCVLHIHRDPIDTSLGRLVYQGSVQQDGFYAVSSSPTLRFVRLFLRSHDFTLVTYAPESSAKHRYTFTTSFVFRLFRVAGWSVTTGDNGDDEHTQDAMVARSFVVDALAVRNDKLLAIRLLLRYLFCHGSKPPTRDMMPAALERRLREQRESDERADRAKRQRELELVISVQSAARRLLAIRRVQSLALQSYTKSLDPVVRQLVYLHRRIHDVLTYQSKPHTLREKDAIDPVDEWLLNVDAASPATRYFNPRRGVFSSLNDVQAAMKLQTWFRRTMWTRGFSVWNLRQLSKALLFHHHVHTPSNLSDINQVEQITNYALQRHLLEHDYKQASTLYEAALKLSPDHVPALVGLAVLLIYTCRYPAKQSWARGLQLLDHANQVNTALSVSLADIEQNCFRWAMYLHAKNTEALGNYAVFLQCVRGELDKAEVLYRRAIDLDPANERIIENYLRLQRERTPEGIYSDAGPSKIAVWRAHEIRRVIDTDWRELEDTGARFASATHFFQNLRTGLSVWILPATVDTTERIS